MKHPPDRIDTLYEQLKMSARVAKAKLGIALVVHENGTGTAEMWQRVMMIGG